MIPDVARPGDTVELTFRVPNERDGRRDDRARALPPAGRAGQDRRAPGLVLRGQGQRRDRLDARHARRRDRRPAAREDFKVTLGPLPQGDRIVFKALQTYADGQVVRWIQDTGDDDERPAAILDLSGGGGEADSGSLVLIIVIVALPLIALVIVGVLVTRRRRRDI